MEKTDPGPYPVTIAELRVLDKEIQRLQHRRAELYKRMNEEDQKKYKALYSPTFEL